MSTSVETLDANAACEVVGAAGVDSRGDERASRGVDMVLDWSERLVVAAFFCWLVVRLVVDFRAEGKLGSLLAIPSEGLVVLFMLIRRPSRAMSHRPLEWAVALTVTCLPMLVIPASDCALAPPAVGAVVLLMGTMVQLHAKLVLGRSLGCVPAHRGLRLGGPYRFVRHPMYAGYLLCHLGFLSANASAWNAGVYGLCLALQIPRLLMEERILGEDPCYRDYQGRVPYRLLPGVF